ncbi:MAG: hypothetical protein ACFB12_24260 [Leptolyngbyaceae cyanobacterium]
MKRKDIKKRLKGHALGQHSVASISKLAGQLNLEDSPDAEYSESDFHLILNCLQEQVSGQKNNPNSKKKTHINKKAPEKHKVIKNKKEKILNFPTYRQDVNSNFDYYINVLSSLRDKFNQKLDTLEYISPREVEKHKVLIEELEGLARVPTGTRIGHKGYKYTNKDLKVIILLSDLYNEKIAKALSKIVD